MKLVKIDVKTTIELKSRDALLYGEKPGDLVTALDEAAFWEEDDLGDPDNCGPFVDVEELEKEGLLNHREEGRITIPMSMEVRQRFIYGECSSVAA